MLRCSFMPRKIIPCLKGAGARQPRWGMLSRNQTQGCQQVPEREPANTSDLLLQGRYVRLVPLELRHVQGLADAASEDRGTYAFTSVPEGEKAMREYVVTAISDREAGRAVPFATIDKNSGQVVGTTRFATFAYHPWPPGSPLQRGTHLPDDVEIGWTWLAASAQRTPVNTEAKLLMLGHAFEFWRVHVVRFKTDARNERSRKAILRLGAHYDGALRSHVPASDGTMRDSAYFSILDGEWPAVRAALESRLQRSLA